MNPRDGDVTKLPKWAQRHIENIERDLEHWRAKALSGPDDASIFVREYPDSKPIADRTDSIDFVLGDELPYGVQRVTVKFDDHDPRALRFNGGSHRLVIVGSSSNEFAIRVEDPG